MMEDQETILDEMKNPDNAVEFHDATLAWKTSQPLQNKKKNSQPSRRNGGMRKVLRREKLSLYISTEDEKAKDEEPSAGQLLTQMEQESPESTISSTQSVRPPINKSLHHINLSIRKVILFPLICFQNYVTGRKLQFPLYVHHIAVSFEMTIVQ